MRVIISVDQKLKQLWSNSTVGIWSEICPLHRCLHGQASRYLADHLITA